MTFIYRLHAVERMFEREISHEAVELCIRQGKVIERYPDDTPYPSFLTMCIDEEGEALHVVYARDGEKYIVITAYRPDREKWSDDFTKRRDL